MTPSPHPDGVSVSGDEGREGGSHVAPGKAIVSEEDRHTESDLEYAKRLATVAAEFYGPPLGWRPLDDMSGVLSQIDNALTGLALAPLVAPGVSLLGDAGAPSGATSAKNPLPLPPTMAPPAAGSDLSGPIDMILFCPRCGEQHIDAPEAESWNNPPHRSHLCRACGHIWRPADVPTNGVYTIGTRGKNDSPRAASDPQPSIPQGESTAAVSGGEHDEGPFSALVDAEWQTLLEKDDRTSPEDYPDMCLVTRTELACAMTEAFVYGTSLPLPPAAGQDLSEAVLDEDRLARIVHAHVMPEEPWEDCPGMHDDHRALVRALLSAASPPPPTLPDLEGVKTALRPFARVAETLDASGPWRTWNAETHAYGWTDLLPDDKRRLDPDVTMADFRRARAALQALEAKDV